MIAPHNAKAALRRKVHDAAPTPVDRECLVDGDLNALLGYHLRMAQMIFYRDFAATLSPLQLTQMQFAALVLINANPGTSQAAIANRLGADRATMMAIVDRLEDRSLLTRERSKTDRRRQELILTEAGLATLEAARPLIQEHERRFTERFSGAEAIQLMDALKRIHGQS